MSVILKHEILETLQDCINILSRGEQGIDEDEYIQKKEELEVARQLLDASQIHFKPLMNYITIH